MTIVSKLPSRAHVVEYPMSTISLDELMKLTAMVPHQDWKKKGKIVDFKDGMVVIFISHQWCADRHPDPDFNQFRTLQKVMRKILDQKLTVLGDFVNQTVFHITDKITATDVAKMQHAFFWYDYFAIPQFALSPDDEDLKADFLGAIRSIPAYVGHSQFFFILAPSVPHCNKDIVVNYATWRTRGWCRVERAARAFSTGNTSMVRVLTEDNVDIIGPFDYLHHQPGTGEYTDDKDKAFVAIVQEDLVRSKITSYFKKGDMHNFRLLMCMREHLLEGLESAWEELTMDGDTGARTDDAMALFFGEIRLPWNLKPDDAGWTALHYAAVAGNIPAMKGILAMSANMEHGTQKEDPGNYLPKGMNALQLCAHFNNKPEPIEFLIDAKADVNSHKGNGFKNAPLLFTTISGKLTALKTLIRRGANIDQRNIFGLSALDGACLHMNDTLIAELIEAGASLKGTTDHVNPLHWLALLAGSGKGAAMLADAGVDVNEQVSMRWDTVIGILWGMKGYLDHRRGQKTKFAYTCYHFQKATPLIVAAIVGNRDVAEELLNAGASWAVRNARGQTASSIAKDGGYNEDFVALLSTGLKTIQTKPSENCDGTPQGQVAKKEDITTGTRMTIQV